MQTKLHQWAISDRDRRFDDLFNLVYDPAVLVVAWRRVRGNKGKRSAGVDRVRPVDTPSWLGFSLRCVMISRRRGLPRCPCGSG